MFVKDAIYLSIVAYVLFQVLTEPGELLFQPKQWLNKFVGRLNVDLANHFVECAKCQAGQLALWWYIFDCFVRGHQSYLPEVHILLICTTIFFTIILNNITEWMKRVM